MSSYDTLLQRLQSTRKAPARSGIVQAHRANCPACAGRMTLSAAESDAGVVLLHCFKGCSAGDIVQALSLDLAQLFPANPAAQGRGCYEGPREWISAAAAVDAVESAAWCILMQQGDPVDAFQSLHDAAAAFKAAARDAMRGAARGRAAA